MSASVIARGAAALAKSPAVRKGAGQLVKKAVQVVRGGKTFTQQRLVKPTYAGTSTTPAAKPALADAANAERRARIAAMPKSKATPDQIMAALNQPSKPATGVARKGKR